jgi:hypothetical protein
VQEQRRQHSQQKARLRTLKYRLKSLEPKKQSLKDLAASIEAHADQGTMTWDDYMVRPSAQCGLQRLHCGQHAR